MADPHFNGAPIEPTADERDALWRKVHKLRMAMLTTHDRDGNLTSRPITTQQAQSDGVLWFFVPVHGGMADELAHDPRVILNYADVSDHFFVALTGTGRILHDRAKIRELWNAMAGAWFPLGPDDPNLALLRIDVDKGEYWDPGASTMVQMFAIARAAITHTPPQNAGEHRAFRN